MKKYIFIILIVGTADSLPAPKPRKILDPAVYLIPHPPLIATSKEMQQENSWVIPLVAASGLDFGNNDANVPIITSLESEPAKEVDISSPGTGIRFQGMKVQAFLKPYQSSSTVNKNSFQKVADLADNLPVHKTEETHIQEGEHLKKDISELSSEKPLKSSGTSVEEIIPTAEELKTAETFWSSPSYGYAGSNYGRYASGYLGYGNAYGSYGASRPAWTGGWGNGKWGHYGSG